MSDSRFVGQPNRGDLSTPAVEKDARCLQSALMTTMGTMSTGAAGTGPATPRGREYQV